MSAAAKDRPEVPAHPVSLHRAWQMLRALAESTRAGGSWRHAVGFRLDGCDRLESVSGDIAWATWDPGAGWRCHVAADDVRAMLELYLPVCEPPSAGSFVVGHIGQSLDGCIATRSGDSAEVTGRDNIVHLHRLRALCDAIVVGAGTVAADNPRLTTRLVPGRSPLRVVLDPGRRLDPGLGIFTDGAAPTLVVCRRGATRAGAVGQSEVLELPADGAGLDLTILLAELRHRGCRRVMIEGGGVTVSRFLDAGLLDRLHVAISPVIIGDGRRGLQLPPAASMRDCNRPRHRVYRMGDDVLFDCEPGAQARHRCESAALRRMS